MAHPEERVKCESCVAMIRRVDAKHQNGRCATCERNFQISARQSVCETLLECPPNSQEEIETIADQFTNLEKMWIQPFLISIRPPTVGPASCTNAEFISALKTAYQKYADDPSKFGSEFHHLCEPFEKSVSNMVDGIKRIPSPINWIYTVYLAHGNVGLGSFDQALSNLDKGLDQEIEQGLKLLGCDQACGLLEIGRRKLKFRLTGCLPDAVDTELCDQFLDALQGYDFVEKILIPFIDSEINDRPREG